MHCLIHYLNCYYIYLISAMCSIFCWIYYRVVVKINLYQCQCQCQYVVLVSNMKSYSNSYFANIDYVICYMYRERAVLLCCKYVMFCNMLSSYVFLMMSNCHIRTCHYFLSTFWYMPLATPSLLTFLNSFGVG